MPRITTPEEYDPFYSGVDFVYPLPARRSGDYNPPAGVPYSLYRKKPTSYKGIVRQGIRLVLFLGAKLLYNSLCLSVPNTF